MPLLEHADASKGVLECERCDYVTRHELRADACSAQQLQQRERACRHSLPLLVGQADA